MRSPTLFVAQLHLLLDAAGLQLRPPFRPALDHSPSKKNHRRDSEADRLPLDYPGYSPPAEEYKQGRLARLHPDIVRSLCSHHRDG
jgi:hypothetical protein